MNKANITDISLLFPLLAWVCLSTFWGVQAKGTVTQDNEAPEVSFLAPAQDGRYEPDSRIPYKISVSDREDGESKYDEIAPGEVLLEAIYVPMGQYVENKEPDSHVTDKGLLGIAASNCLYCHAFRGNLIGPSFAEIGLNYQQTKPGMDEIAARILNGSTGVWGDKFMPSHPELTPAQVDEMLSWVVKYAARNEVQYYHGLEGTINMPSGTSTGKGEGRLVLTAVYRDHGSGGASKKTGTDRVVLRVQE
jgi:cytochrome c